jgi:hypothetical protein
MTGLLSLVVVRKLVDLGGHAEEDMFCVSMSGSVVGFGLRMGRHWQKISVLLTGWDLLVLLIIWSLPDGCGEYYRLVSCLAEIVLRDKIEDGRGLVSGYKVKHGMFWHCREAT